MQSDPVTLEVYFAGADHGTHTGMVLAALDSNVFLRLVCRTTLLYMNPKTKPNTQTEVIKHLVSSDLLLFLIISFSLSILRS